MGVPQVTITYLLTQCQPLTCSIAVFLQPFTSLRAQAEIPLPGLPALGRRLGRRPSELSREVQVFCYYGQPYVCRKMLCVIPEPSSLQTYG